MSHHAPWAQAVAQQRESREHVDDPRSKSITRSSIAVVTRRSKGDAFRLGYSFAERRGFPLPGFLCLPRGRTELTHSAVKRALPLSRWFGDGCHALRGEEWDRGVRSAEVGQRQSSW